MRSDEQRREHIRDMMLIDMARGIQILLDRAISPPDEAIRMNAMTVHGRLESHIQFLAGSHQ